MENEFIKVSIEVDHELFPHVGMETMWGEPIGDNQVRLQNSPFHAYGYSFLDIVEVEPDSDGLLIITRAVERSGHSTYRVFILDDEINTPKFLEYWQPLQNRGCTFEGSDSKYLSIDVPPTTNIKSVYEHLEKGINENYWDFEEAHCGHPECQ